MRHDLIKEIYKTRTFIIDIACTIVVYRPRHFTMHPPPLRLQVDQNVLTQKIVAGPKIECHQNSVRI